MSGVFLGNVKSINVIRVTLDPASVAANTTAEQTFSVPGLLLGDFVEVSKPSATAGLGIVNVRVSAADTLAMTFSNNTGSPIDAAAELYSIKVTRPELGGGNNVIQS